MIDSFTVVRSKAFIPTNCSTEHYGTRTDHIVVRPGSGAYHLLPKEWRPKAWLFPAEGNGLPNWVQYWKKYSPKLAKYSHGLAAAFLAMEHLAPAELTVIGYDRLMGRFETGKSWETKRDAFKYTLSAHNWEAEMRALHDLCPIKELTCQSFSSTTPSLGSRLKPHSTSPPAR